MFEGLSGTALLRLTLNAPPPHPPGAHDQSSCRMFKAIEITMLEEHV